MDLKSVKTESNNKYAGRYKEYKKNWHLMKMYGITAEEYNVMFAQQDGRCGCCGKHQMEFKKNFAVDHVHGTDPVEVRGLLCSNCNTGIGKLGDNIEGLKKALKYLEDTA